jgi:2-C-methyl-D-erythritol 4-phosphate cytidylyltransferase
MVVERESSVRAKLTEGSYRNLKITTPEDLEIAQMWKERAR